MAWTVSLTGNKEQLHKVYNLYGTRYFPRRFHYKKDATECLKKVKELCAAELKKTQ